MKILKEFIDRVVKAWPNMTETQKNHFCDAMCTGNLVIIMKTLKEIENEN